MSEELSGDDLHMAVAKAQYPGADASLCPYQFSTDWAQGGPIIEREGISVYKMGHQWMAGTGGGHGNAFGPTPLIAAMRCYVASKTK